MRKFYCLGRFFAASGLLFWGVAASVESSQPHGEYGTIKGFPIPRAGYDACGGKIPAGCPGGVGGMLNKHESIRRQNQ